MLTPGLRVHHLWLDLRQMCISGLDGVRVTLRGFILCLCCYIRPLGVNANISGHFQQQRWLPALQGWMHPVCPHFFKSRCIWMFGFFSLITVWDWWQNNLCIQDKQCNEQIRLHLIALKSMRMHSTSRRAIFNDKFKCFYVNIVLFTLQVEESESPGRQFIT